jgi:hypothetical protein
MTTKLGKDAISASIPEATMDETTEAAINEIAGSIGSGIRSTIESFYSRGFWDGYVLRELGVEPWDDVAREQHDRAMERQMKRAAGEE